MLYVTRHQQIYTMIKNKGSVTVAELQESFGVSLMTIRRDLKVLSDSGLIKRVHGGAALSKMGDETLFIERTVVNSDLKQAITKYAVSQIEMSDTIYIDGSTTCSELADLLPEDFGITVVTNSLEAINKLHGRKRISILSLGGDLASDGNTFDGMMAIENAEKIFVDKCFISGSGFTERAVLNSGMIGTSIKKVMLKKSRKRYLLADSTKYNGKGIIELCKWTDIDEFISDDLLPDEIKGKFVNAGLHTHFVPVKNL